MDTKSEIERLAQSGDIHALSEILDIGMRTPDLIPDALNAIAGIGGPPAYADLLNLMMFSQNNDVIEKTKKDAHMLQTLHLLTNDASPNAVVLMTRLSVAFPDFVKDSYEALGEIGTVHAVKALAKLDKKFPEHRKRALEVLEKVDTPLTREWHNKIANRNNENNGHSLVPYNAGPKPQQESLWFKNIVSRLERLSRNGSDDAVKKMHQIMRRDEKLIPYGVAYLHDIGSESAFTVIRTCAEENPIYMRECIDALTKPGSREGCYEVYDLLILHPNDIGEPYDNGHISYAIEKLMENLSNSALITMREMVKDSPLHLAQTFDAFGEKLRNGKLSEDRHHNIIITMRHLMENDLENAAPRGLEILSPMEDSMAVKVFDDVLAKVIANKRKDETPGDFKDNFDDGESHLGL